MNMTENTEEYARIAEQKVKDLLDWDLDNDPFEMGEARVYGLNGADHVLSLIASGKDIYDLLKDKKVRDGVRVFESAVIVTTGWATPLDNNGEIDSRADRIRVRLSIVTTEDSVSSVIRFSDPSREVVVDSGSATGALADAVLALYK